MLLLPVIFLGSALINAPSAKSRIYSACGIAAGGLMRFDTNRMPVETGKK